jgi:hypothetical protein
MHGMSNKEFKFLASLRAEHNSEGGLVTQFYKSIDETGRIIDIFILFGILFNNEVRIAALRIVQMFQDWQKLWL